MPKTCTIAIYDQIKEILLLLTEFGTKNKIQVKKANTTGTY